MSADLFETLTKLGFRMQRVIFAKLVEEATKQRLGPIQAFERLAEAERRARDGVNLARRTRAATLGNFALLDTFEWAHPKRIDKPLYEGLLTMDFVEKCENVLFRGDVGLGKTMLAKNLAHKALQCGYSVRFTTLAGMTAEILRQESLPAATRRQRHYVRPDLLIIDELGYLPQDHRAADALYNVIAERHEKASTIITTNLPFKAWGNVFGQAGSLVALIDRFTQSVYTVDIEGASYRDPKHRKSPSRNPPGRPRRR